MNRNHWWLVSWLVSLPLVLILLFLWVSLSKHNIESIQLVDQAAADDYLVQNAGSYIFPTNEAAGQLIKIKTGIFIQSLKFNDITEFSVKGVLWQHYQDGVHDAHKPEAAEVGFIFPDQINSQVHGKAPEQIFRKRSGDTELIGWNFEVTLRHAFDYALYPFDHQTASIRVWPKNFLDQVVLVPDYAAYGGTDAEDIFGIDQDLVLGKWERKNTYFDFKKFAYETNFGLSSQLQAHYFPELNFNFVLKRKIEDAVISHLLLMFFIATLLFVALLTVSRDGKSMTIHGFNTSGFIASASALLFVAILSNIQLREQFSDVGIVYIEYFYILLYVSLVYAVFATYFYMTDTPAMFGWMHYEDNLIVKITYWPLLLIGLIGITLVVMI